MNTPIAPKELLKECLLLAKIAFNQGEVPVGAIIYDNDNHKIIAKSYNQVEQKQNPLAHAEMLALREATQIKQNKFLNNCDMYVSLEPCPMCASAISLAKIRRLYFSSYDKKSGGVDHGAKIFNSASCHHTPQVYGGICDEDSSKLLKEFFNNLRE